EPSAHAGFENDNLTPPLSKMFKRKGSYDFKKRRMWIPIADAFANFAQPVRDIIFGNHFAVYPNPFAKSDEVRGGKQTNAITGGATDCIDQSADGTFSVRAGDVNDGGCSSQAKSGIPQRGSFMVLRCDRCAVSRSSIFHQIERTQQS